MKRIFTYLLVLPFFICQKSSGQSCVTLFCANAHTGLTTNGGLPDLPGSDLGGACYAGAATYKQVFWEFFYSGTGGNFAQTFTPTVPADGLDLDWFVYDVAATPPVTQTCPISPLGWFIVPKECDNSNTTGVPTGPGIEKVVTTDADEYYAVAIVVWQPITSTFDIGTPTLDAGGGPVALNPLTNCPGLLLPVKLSSFTSTVNNCMVNLNWTAQSQTDFKDYEVQYSTDGSTFHTIADIAAASSSSDQKYSFQQANPQPGRAFYRLKMVDLDGHFEYSKTLAMRVDCSKMQFSVYPNPVIDILNVNITNLQSVMTAKLFNSDGKLIYTGNMISGTNTINMSKFASGVYLLRLISADQVENLKIVK